ncbi:unnamed protein product [Calicophoron daubneyi]|uniref:G-protein coupled receptors family 3 profile domain-containing protein n=1 Tax=Calicophoron daubneyi TaxID=300641 RepID=A0AAV2TV53_CALDB
MMKEATVLRMSQKLYRQCYDWNKWPRHGNQKIGYPAPFINSQIKAASGEKLPRFYCRSCPPGCHQCSVNHSCRARLDLNLLRAIPLAVQSFCITACLLIGIAVFRLRRTKVVKAANWVLMEILLIGAILLYFIIVVMYFPTSDITCLAAPWLRELGFSVMYGVLIVKIYRVLTGFQSRKAHRVHIRNKDILKFLGLFIVTTFAYMIAWTAVNLDYINSSTWDNPDGHPMSMTQRGEISVPLSSAERQQRRVSTQISLNVSMESVENISQSDSIEVLTFDVCRAMSWDVVIELSEFIILAVSVHYCRLVRSAPSEYNEILFIGVALIIELVVSGIVNVTRHFIWYTVHPDYVFLLYFARSHLTVTANLLLIFGPKAWFLYRPLTTIASQSRLRGAPGGPYSADPHLASTAKLNLALNGDLDIADINLADMDSEVIRRELRRLYTQIELYKTKAMRKDNPHISKRRGGRKQRRFSLQPFHKRHHGPPSGNVPLVIQTDSGYCWADCRPSKSEGSGKKSKHSGAHRSGPAFAGSGRAGSYYVYPGLIHDEEISKLSEESTNSLDDPSVGGGGPTQQGQQPLLLGATSSMTTVTTTAPNTTTAPTSPLLSVSKPKPEAKSDEGVKGTSKDQSKTAEFRPD